MVPSRQHERHEIFCVCCQWILFVVPYIDINPAVVRKRGGCRLTPCHLSYVLKNFNITIRAQSVVSILRINYKTINRYLMKGPIKLVCSTSALLLWNQLTNWPSTLAAAVAVDCYCGCARFECRTGRMLQWQVRRGVSQFIQADASLLDPTVHYITLCCVIPTLLSLVPYACYGLAHFVLDIIIVTMVGEVWKYGVPRCVVLCVCYFLGVLRDCSDTHTMHDYLSVCVSVWVRIDVHMGFIQAWDTRMHLSPSIPSITFLWSTRVSSLMC